MTDRINGFTVILNENVRDDDFKAIEDAVLMIKGVQQVIPNQVNSFENEKAKFEFKKKLYEYLDNL